MITQSIETPFGAATSIRELASSRMTIAEEFRYVNSTHQFVGYAARADFHLILDDLDSLEDIVAGLVTAGVTLFVIIWRSEPAYTFC